MSKAYYKLLLCVLFTFLGSNINAYTQRVTIDNLEYTIDTETYTATLTGPTSESDLIQNLVIPDYITVDETRYSVTSIGSYAFKNCSGLKSVAIPNSVTSIGKYAFYDCTGLTSITIPNSVKLIGVYAFSYCSGLTSITIPNSVTSIREFAFNGCTGIKDLIIEDGTETLSLQYNDNNNYNGTGRGLFYDCPLENLYLGRNLLYSSERHLGYSPFYGKETLTSLTIGESVTSIGSCAFYDCTGLTSVIIPSSVTSIDGYAFSGCSGLTSIIIPSSVTSIDGYAFFECSGLTSITIGNSVTSIGKSAFYGCSSLTSVFIPNSVTSIADEAFSGCSGLTSITLPNSLTSVGNDAFNGCTGIKELTIENGEETLRLGYSESRKGLFYDCPLEKLYLGRNLSYGYSPFYGKETLTSLTIGNCVTLIGKSSFSNCNNLTDVKFQSYSIDDIELSGLLKSNLIYLIPKQDGTFSGFENCNLQNYFTNILALYDNQPYAIVGSSDALTFSNTYYREDNLVLVDFDKCVASADDKSLKVAHQGKDVTNKVLSSEGYTFIPSTKFYENIFYVYGTEKNDALSQTVTLNEAGSLFNEIGLQNIEKVEVLKIIGDINGPDVMTINRMTSLKYLDLSEANIVEGGVTYRDNLKTSTGIVGSHFFNDLELEIIYLPNSATTIDSEALQDISSLKVLGIGSNVKSIGESAFSGCSGLNSITIPNSVISIKDYAFNGCTSIKDLTIEDGAETLSMGYNQFYDCPLEKLYLGRNLSYSTNYVYSPFYGKETLNSLTIGNSVTSIGKYAFEGCSGLTSIVIPNSVVSIEEAAFSGCSGLTSITIGNSVTYIGKSAFSGCSGLTSITIPNSVTSIGDNAFNGCIGIKDLTIENGANILSLGRTTSGEGLFYDCPLVKLYLGRNLSYYSSYNYGYSPFYGKETLTSLTIGKSVTLIGNYAFSECSGLTSVIIPNSVTSIGEYAFSSCTGLNTIIIPNSVISIGEYAFSECSYLTSITIGNSVTTIGEYAFYRCSGLTSFIIPNSVTSIGYSAFYGCIGIKDLTIEDGEEALSLGCNKYDKNGEGLFYDCPLENLYLGRNLSYNADLWCGFSPFRRIKTLTSLTIGNTVTTIGEYAFSGCSGLTSVTIPNSVTSIGNSAFSGCVAFTSLDIPNSVTSIGSSAFKNCSGLTSVAIPNSVTSIGWESFYGCSGLTSITIPNSVTSIGISVFYGCSGLTSVTIPNSVTSIAYEAFSGCSGLTSITIPNSVTSIADKAFNECSGLTSVTIGKSVTSIGETAFGNCKNIEKVISLNTTPPEIQSSTFDSEVEESATLHVQKGTLVFYWLDPIWKEFLNMADDILCLDAIPDATYGDGEIDLAQYAPNGVALTYETSNEDVVRIDGTKMRIVGAGTATVGALLAEDGTPMEIIGQMRQFNVEQAELAITVADIEITEGQPLPEFTYLADGLQYNDTLDDIEELPQPVCDVTENSPVGEYPITFTDGQDRNYYFTTRPAKVIISTSLSVDPINESCSDEYVKIYDLNGVMIYEGLRSEARLTHGIYIVSNGKQTAKVYVK